MKFIMNYQRALLILIFMALSGCSSMKPMNEHLTNAQIVNEINPGDEIIILTIDNEKHLIIVESISEESITGSGKTFTYQQIISIEKEGIDVLKTTGAVVGGYLLYATLIVAITLGAL